MAEELQFHIEQYTDELVHSGVSPEEAARRARAEFGSMSAVRKNAVKLAGCIRSMNLVGSCATPPGCFARLRALRSRRS